MRTPSCEKCGKFWDKLTPLLAYGGYYLCGGCLTKLLEYQRKEKRKWLQESDE